MLTINIMKSTNAKVYSMQWGYYNSGFAYYCMEYANTANNTQLISVKMM